LIVLVAAGFVRTFVAEPFLVTATYVEPELPRGSRILVWKLSGNFIAGDVVAYRH
jgi:signal peptidase I